MSDLNDTTPAPEPVEVPVDNSVDVAPAEPVEPPPLSDEDYRLNFLGTHKFELPKEAPEEVRQSLKELEKSLNKGWTQSNQRLAEERRAFLSQQQEAFQQVAAQQAMVKELAKVEALQERLSEYDKLALADWQRWSEQDPDAARNGLIEHQTLQRQVSQRRAEIEAKQREAITAQQHSMVQFLSQAEARLSTEIKDWSADKKATLARFVGESYLNTGTPLDQGAYQAINFHPGLVRMAEDARLYRESLKRATAPAPTTQATQPVTRVGGPASTQKDPTKMSDAEWFEWRNRDLAQKRSLANLNRGRR